jgi:hypothetical protein
MTIRERLKSKKRLKELKKYYKKPSILKTVLPRGLALLLVFAVIILMITVKSYGLFVQGQRLYPSGVRATYYENCLKNAYEIYFAGSDEGMLKNMNEVYGRELTEDELKVQYELYLRSMLGALYNSRANIYDENMQNGIMDFDKPFLELKRSKPYTPKNSKTGDEAANVYYKCSDEAVVDELNKIKNISDSEVYIEMKGYYLKDMDFIPGEIYLSAAKFTVDCSYILQDFFAEGESYYDSDSETEMMKIKLDIPLKSKDELIADGYAYSDEIVNGAFSSVAATLSVIYPYDEAEKELITDSKEMYEWFSEANHMKIDEEYDYSSESDMSFFERQSYDAQYGKHIILGEGDKKRTFNLIAGMKVNYWDCTCPIKIPGLWEHSYKEVLMFGCSVAAVLWIIFTAVLSVIAYQKKKNTYEMNVYQRDLTNIMAHDLKSPLMVIRGSAENLQDEMKSENEYARTIIEESDYMSSLISRILSLSKLDSNQTEMKREDVDIKSIFDEIIEKYSDETKKRGIKTSIESGDRIRTIKADAFWIKEALTNLYDNAVKYSDDGSEIRINLGEKEISISNKMTDSEIKEKDIKKLKKSFVRGDNARSGQNGNGLGLSIADSILMRNNLSLTLKKQDDIFIALIK